MGRRPDIYELNVNMPRALGEKLKARAKRERRSITAVVLAALFPEDYASPPEESDRK